MNETGGGDGGRRGRRGRGESGGADARRALRRGTKAAKKGFIQRGIPPYRLLGEEGLALIEENADTVLEEIGIEFHDDPEALATWRRGRRRRQDGRAGALSARPLPLR